MGALASRLSLCGYDLLGDDGQDGVRYAWKAPGFEEVLESASFIDKTRGRKGEVSGYTASVSMGCILQQMGCACRFCRTGMLLPYRFRLTGEEIALQNVSMVLVDMNRGAFGECATKAREFAYMGQGEPAYSYPQVRRAIRITDAAMDRLGQKTFRHIFSTSGVPDGLKSFADDLESGFFSSRVTLHFSLHSLLDRRGVMPIDARYPYESLISTMERISRAEGEKVCLGLLLFREFCPKGRSLPVNTTVPDVGALCHVFDPRHFRFSLCEFNASDDLGSAETYDADDAHKMLDYLRSAGYDAKLFYSYGREKRAACGMLAGKEPDEGISEKWRALEEQAFELVRECGKELFEG